MDCEDNPGAIRGLSFRDNPAPFIQAERQGMKEPGRCRATVRRVPHRQLILLQNDVHDMLQAGDRAPDLTLTTLDGQPISLAETAWRGGHTALLVFLRHLG